MRTADVAPDSSITSSDTFSAVEVAWAPTTVIGGVSVPWNPTGCPTDICRSAIPDDPFRTAPPRTASNAPCSAWKYMASEPGARASKSSARSRGISHPDAVDAGGRGSTGAMSGTPCTSVVSVTISLQPTSMVITLPPLPSAPAPPPPPRIGVGSRTKKEVLVDAFAQPPGSASALAALKCDRQLPRVAALSVAGLKT